MFAFNFFLSIPSTVGVLIANRFSRLILKALLNVSGIT
jgi:hypothetical protein